MKTSGEPWIGFSHLGDCPKSTHGVSKQLWSIENECMREKEDLTLVGKSGDVGTEVGRPGVKAGISV